MSLLPVDKAKARILKGVKPLAGETIKLERALGRVLARDLKASRNQPPFDSSAMDGYAVRFADVAAAPARLRMIGMSAAGHAFRGHIKSGETVRIFTGAPVPAGADTVVIQEDTEAQGESVVVVQAPAREGLNIRRSGLDFAKGDVVLRTNTMLTARDLAVAAAANHPELLVRKKPRVAILATGGRTCAAGHEAARRPGVCLERSRPAGPRFALRRRAPGPRHRPRRSQGDDPRHRRRAPCRHPHDNRRGIGWPA